MNAEQRALRFNCNGSGLVGIVEVPERPLPRGVLVVTGGPQYRVGSHRQFTMLARTLSQRGIPVMRFDRRGMGDSEGEPRNFERIDDDIRAAMKEFFMQVPEMCEVVIWGLCDAAAATAFYVATDDRVRGLVLLDPCMRTRRERAPLRKKIASGDLDIFAGASPLRGPRGRAAGAEDSDAPLPRHVLDSLAGYAGQVLVILSSGDPTAAEFARVMARNNVRAKRIDVSAASHTFAGHQWRVQVAEASANWIMSW